MPAMQFPLAVATAAHQFAPVLLAGLAHEGLLAATVVALLVATHASAVAGVALQFARALAVVAGDSASAQTILTLP